MNTTEVRTETPRRRRKRTPFICTVFRRIVKNHTALIGLIIFAIMILTAVFAPLIAPYDPLAMDYSAVKQPPSAAHPFGTDAIGRDLLTRCIYGARYSLILGFSSAIIGVACGLIFGTLIGYAGGEIDMIFMRLCDVFTSLPGNLISILLSNTLGEGFIQTVLAMSIGGIPRQIRGVRAMCLKEREQEYLEAARAINCSRSKIMFKHMLPNIVSPSIVSMTMGIGNTILGASALSYIGLGVRPPTAEWGALLSAGKSDILTCPYLLIFPGLCIAITVLATNMFGDGLRDALDPRLKD